MKIDTAVLLPITALVASGLLLMAGSRRIFELIALIASGAWLALEVRRPASSSAARCWQAASSST